MTSVFLKCAREAAGLKQGEFAKEIGVSRSTVVAWEVGRRPIKAWNENRIVRLLAPKVRERNRWLEKILCDYP